MKPSSNFNNIGGVIGRIKKWLSELNINPVINGVQFYRFNGFDIVNNIINSFETQLSQCSSHIIVDLEISCDISKFTMDDYSYIKTRLSADLTEHLKVFVVCHVLDKTTEETTFLTITAHIPIPPPKIR